MGRGEKGRAGEGTGGRGREGRGKGVKTMGGKEGEGMEDEGMRAKGRRDSRERRTGDRRGGGKGGGWEGGIGGADHEARGKLLTAEHGKALCNRHLRRSECELGCSCSEDPLMLHVLRCLKMDGPCFKSPYNGWSVRPPWWCAHLWTGRAAAVKACRRNTSLRPARPT